MQLIDLRQKHLDIRFPYWGRGTPLVIDLETTGLNQHTDRILCASVAYESTSAFLISPAQLKDFLTFCVNSNIRFTFIFHNQSFDLKMLFRLGINIDALTTRDTMLMHHLIDENAEHGLDSLIKAKYADAYKEVFWTKYKTFEEAPEEEKTEYACKDAMYTFRIYEDFRQELKGREGLIEHVHRLSRSLIATEIYGVKIDMPYLQELGVKLQVEIKELQIAMRNTVDSQCRIWELGAWTKELEQRKTPKGKANVECPTFNFDSGKQLGVLLYEQLGLPEQKHPKTRKRTVDDAAMNALGDAHPVVSLLRDYREKQKLFGTYVEGILERQVHGIIYPSFNVNGTVAGRISHSDPNLGNIPKDNTVRGIFVPN